MRPGIDASKTGIIVSRVKDAILRVDDRLVHGQVIAGWLPRLGIRRIVLANDAAAADGFEQEVYRAAVPSDVELVIVPVARALSGTQGLNHVKTMLLVASVSDARRVVEAGLEVAVVNIGGIHPAPGRREILSFVFLSADEVEECRFISGLGVRIEAQMLPGSPVYGLRELTAGGE